MTTAHLLVMYPNPKDAAIFDRRYREEHLPYAAPRLVGATGVVSKHVRTPDGQFYAISDITFPSLEVLSSCASSKGGREAIEHATSISTGGPPTVVVLTDDL